MISVQMIYLLFELGMCRLIGNSIGHFLRIGLVKYSRYFRCNKLVSVQLNLFDKDLRTNFTSPA